MSNKGNENYQCMFASYEEIKGFKPINLKMKRLRLIVKIKRFFKKLRGLKRKNEKSI